MQINAIGEGKTETKRRKGKGGEGKEAWQSTQPQITKCFNAIQLIQFKI